MGKYLDLEKDIFSVIQQIVDANGYKVYPSNFVATNPGNKFLRFAVIPAGKGINLKSVSGLLIIDIFTPVGDGPRDTSLIADALDSKLVGKSIKTGSIGTTQLGDSTLDAGRTDKDSPSLFRATYSIPFNFYGV